MRDKASFLVSGILLLAASFTLAVDLKWRSPIELDPVDPRSGNTVTFECKLKSGGGPSTDVKVVGKIDGSQVWSRTYPSFATDQTEWVEFDWLAVAGNHTVAFVIDPEGTTEDTNPLNNERALEFSVRVRTPYGAGIKGRTLTVISSGSPIATAEGKIDPKTLRPGPCYVGHVDLVVRDFRFRNRIGNIVYFTANIKNLGTKCLRRIPWKSMDSKGTEDMRELVATPPEWALKREQQKPILIWFDRSLLKGFHTVIKDGKTYLTSRFIVIVDPDNEIPETNDGNNATRWTEYIWGLAK